MASSYRLFSLYTLLFFGFVILSVKGKTVLPLIINTWAFTNATEIAWSVISKDNSTALDAVEAGCAKCETMQCDGSVGYGGSPDESGETELDAMIMDGITHDVGAVGCLRNVKNAIGVARAVMDYTEQTFLVGDLATDFAIAMGFKKEDLHTNRSKEIYKQWRARNCQPNFRQNVQPDPKKSCGPYKPKKMDKKMDISKRPSRLDKEVNHKNHDTIGIIVIDVDENIASGTSTNGLNHKVPGRVGDSPIMGAGAYADNEFGGAAATGDGDVMMRFLPSFNAVSLLGRGVSPSDAAKQSIQPIIKYYPDFSGAVIVADTKGNYGAACHGMSSFPYTVRNPSLPTATVMSVVCI